VFNLCCSARDGRSLTEFPEEPNVDFRMGTVGGDDRRTWPAAPSSGAPVGTGARTSEQTWMPPL